MKLTKPQSWNFWYAESSLTALLIFTLVYLFVLCVFGALSFGGFVGRLSFSLIIVAGVLTTFRQRLLRFLGIVLAVANLTLTWMEYIHRAWSLTFLSALLGMLFLVLLLAILIVQVFQAGTVTGHRIRGAILGLPVNGGDVELFLLCCGLDHPPCLQMAGRYGHRRFAGGPAGSDVFQFHYSNYHRVRRCHSGHLLDSFPGYVRGTGGATLPGRHPDPVGVSIGCLPKLTP
jgi:hypothetical protein